MRKTSLYILAFFLLLASASCAQKLSPVQSQSAHHKVYKLNKSASPENPLTFPDSFTAFALETTDTQSSFQGIKVLLNSGFRTIKPTAHPNREKQGVRSEMVMVPARTNTLKLQVPESQVPLKIHLLDADGQGSKSGSSRSKANSGSCQKPSTISQEQWRDGLPAPNYNPIEQDTRHVIVHHSAGNTGDTNTREVIRNIYLFHTDVNGWSDIGYNFVIGVNGRIYQARDGLGKVPDHRVKGAHYCGKNSGTMGVALIGNFEEGKPTQEALASLKNLLSWKMPKSGLSPTAEAPHPTFEPDPEPLGRIACHKTGCATLCPGKNLHPKIPGIRKDVQDSTRACEPVSTENVDKRPSKIFIQGITDQKLEVSLPNPKSGQLFLYDIRGRKMAPALPVKSSQSHYGWTFNKRQANGLYILVLMKADGHVASRKKVMLH